MPEEEEEEEEEGQARPVILSANIHSVASPLTTRPSPMEQHSPAVITLEEENSETSAQDSTQRNSDSPLQDEPEMKVIFFVFFQPYQLKWDSVGSKTNF